LSTITPPRLIRRRENGPENRHNHPAVLHVFCQARLLLVNHDRVKEGLPMLFLAFYSNYSKHLRCFRFQKLRDSAADAAFIAVFIGNNSENSGGGATHCSLRSQ
jgi:hypothetical protein